VLNSYPGQASYTEPSYTIYSSPYAYKNFTDYIGITENDKIRNRFKFEGRIYNKIKGTISECVIDGGPVYTPLVYDRTTGENYNLTFSNGQLVPKMYLCLEVLPYVSFYQRGKVAGIGTCHSWWDGKISLYFAKFDGSKLIRVQSYNDITSYYESKNATSDLININTITNASGENIVEKIINNLKDNGTKGFDIIPIVFTTIKGKAKNVTSHRGNSEWYNKTQEGSFGNVDIDNSDSPIICSRNGDNQGQNEFEIETGGTIPATIGVLINNNLYIVDSEFVDLSTSSNHSVLAQKIFNLLAQIYVINGSSGTKTYNCLKDFDYQKDCVFRVNIKGNVKTTISEQYIVKKCTNNYYNNWTTNNLQVKQETKSYGFESYKLFSATQNAIDGYKLQLESNVRKEFTPNTVTSFLNVSIPDS
jgi:hypothetical protein